MTTFRPDRFTDDHGAHDRPLVVAYASGDLHGDDALAARALIDACRRCAALSGEVAALRSSIAADLSVPRRQRDFRLGADDAERLRAGLLTRWLRRLGGPGMAVLQPLAGAAMTIGLVLVVATGVLPGLGMGGGAPAADLAALRASAQSNQTQGGAGSDIKSGPGTTVPPAPVGPQAAIETSTQPMVTFDAVVAPGPDPALLGGLVLMVVGGSALTLRLGARRVAEDPLLR